jgi:hypothetical protein
MKNNVTRITYLTLIVAGILTTSQASGMERLSQLWSHASGAISQRATPFVMERVAAGSGVGIIAGLLMHNPYVAGMSALSSIASLYISGHHNPVVKDFQRQANDALLHNKNFFPILQRLESSRYDRSILATAEILTTAIVPAIHQRAQQLTLEIQNKLETHSPQEVIELYLNNESDTRVQDLRDLNKCNDYSRDYYEQVLAPVRSKSKELMQQFVNNIATDVQAGKLIREPEYRQRYEQLLSDDKRIFRKLLDRTIKQQITSRAPLTLEEDLLNAFNNKHNLDCAIKSCCHTMNGINPDYTVDVLFEQFAHIVHPIAHRQTEQIIEEIEKRFEYSESPKFIAYSIAWDSRYKGFSLPQLEQYRHKIDATIKKISKQRMLEILNDLVQDIPNRDLNDRFVQENFLNKISTLLDEDKLQASKLFERARAHQYIESTAAITSWVDKYVTQTSSIKDFPLNDFLLDRLRKMVRQNKFDDNVLDSLRQQVIKDVEKYLFNDQQKQIMLDIDIKNTHGGYHEQFKATLLNRFKDLIDLLLTAKQMMDIALKIQREFEEEITLTKKSGADYSYTLTWNKVLVKWQSIFDAFAFPFSFEFTEMLKDTYKSKIASLTSSMREDELKSLIQQYRSLRSQGYPEPQVIGRKLELKAYVDMIQKMIENGINPYARDSGGRNAFDEAQGDTMLTDVLLDTRHSPPISNRLTSNDPDHAPTMIEAFLDHHYTRGVHSKAQDIFTWLGDPQNIRLLAMERRERQFIRAPKDAPEKAEYCVFYHAHQGLLRLFQDIGRRIFEFEHQRIAQDFIPLRFWHDAQATSDASQFIVAKGLDKGTAWTGINDNNTDIMKNILAVNLSLLGNSYVQGESTMWYYRDNRSIAKDIIEGLFRHIFEYYDFDASKMEDAFRCGWGTFQHGSVMQIFIPRQYVDRVVYLAEPWGLPYKTDLGFEGFEMCGSVKSQQKIIPIIDSIRKGTFIAQVNQQGLNGPQRMDKLQARIVLGKDVMLNDKSGVKMFRNDNLSSASVASYTNAIHNFCQQLFIDWLERILQRNPDGTCGVKQEALNRIKDTPLGKFVQNHDQVRALLQKLRAEAWASASKDRQSKL